MTHAVGGDIGKDAAVKVVDIQVMTGTFDLDGQPRIVGREPWVKERLRRQRNPFSLSASIHPHERPCASVANSRNVGQIAASRDIEVGHASVPAHQYAL